MALLIAIRHGVDAETAETYKHQLRLTADIAARSLSIVGLRSGEVQQFEVSERFQQFLTAWSGGGGSADDPRTIDVTPARGGALDQDRDAAPGPAPPGALPPAGPAP